MITSTFIPPTMKKSNETQETKHFVESEEVAERWEKITKIFEAASFQGKPVYFQVVVPWNETQRTIAETKIVEMILVGMMSGLFIGVVFLVWLNIKKGRADLRGTGRLVLFSAILILATKLIIYDHVFPSLQEFEVLISIILHTLFGAFFMRLLYCALEPFVRRWWSEYLISWNRLLVGDFRDPMVGRDVLIGGVAANLGSLLWLLVQFIKEFGLGETRTLDRNFRWWVTESFSAFNRRLISYSDRFHNYWVGHLGDVPDILFFHPQQESHSHIIWRDLVSLRHSRPISSDFISISCF